MHPVQAKAKKRRNAVRRRDEIMTAYIYGRMPAGRMLRLLCRIVRHGRRRQGYVAVPLP